MRTVAFYTLGCKLNFSETSTIARLFINNGFEKVEVSENADVYVINTCSVTEQSDKKCRQAIKKFTKQSPNAIIAITGCYAQLKPNEVASIKGVDLVIGTDAKDRIVEHVNSVRNKCEKAHVFSCDINDVDSFFNAFSSGDRTRSFLKVQDGCSYNCSYCTIPMARGKSRNPDIVSILDEARKISELGSKEIILTGVNIGDFGRGNNEKFIDLLKALENIDGIERYRISSIEPNLLTNEIIEFVASSEKYLPHYHLPLQSGSNKILKLMRRRYVRELLHDKIEALRNKHPFTFFGIDVIVGFPNETDDDFNDTYSFLKDLNPAYLHIFPYSERPGTASACMSNKVSQTKINERVKTLTQLSNQMHSDFYRANIGRNEKVLFESTVKKGMMYGFTGNYIKVETPYNENLVGKIISVKLTGIANSGNIQFVDSTNKRNVINNQLNTLHYVSNFNYFGSDIIPRKFSIKEKNS